MSDFLLLCWEFFKAGLFAVGGGLATLPFIHEMARTYDWFTEADVANMIAVSESTPGPMGVNMATFAGYKTYGIPGAVAATFSLVLPSYIVIVIIAKFLDKFSENPHVIDAFYGLRPAVGGLVLAAWLSIFQIAVLTLPRFQETGAWTDFANPAAAAIFVLLLTASYRFKRVPPVTFIAAGALLGILFL
jgi:chromate transporter